MQRIDPEADAMRQQRQPDALVELRQIVPERRIIAKLQIGLPGGVTFINDLFHRTVLQIGGLRRHVDLADRSLEAGP